MRIGIVAGEASGDLLGARLIQVLRKNNPSLQVEGIAGPKMLQEGCRSFFDIENLSVMGFLEPLKRLPKLIHIRRSLYRHFANNKPDVFVGVDAPDFNLGLEYQLKRLGIPTVHYVSPSVWAWRQYRVRKIAKSVDTILTLFPFEKDFYDRHDVPSVYVGHPFAIQTPLSVSKSQARSALSLDANKRYVTILPGSRKQEIAHLAETFLKAACLIQQARQDVEFIATLPNQIRLKEFVAHWRQVMPGLPLHCFLSETKNVLAAADAVMVTSGTATFEAMLFKKPMVIAYKMPNWTYQIAKRIVKTPFIGLPNVLAQRMIVPELIQDAATPNRIAEMILDYLHAPEKVAALEARFHDLHQQLRVDASDLINSVFDGLIARDEPLRNGKI